MKSFKKFLEEEVLSERINLRLSKTMVKRIEKAVKKSNKARNKANKVNRQELLRAWIDECLERNDC